MNQLNRSFTRRGPGRMPHGKTSFGETRLVMRGAGSINAESDILALAHQGKFKEALEMTEEHGRCAYGSPLRIAQRTLDVWRSYLS